MLRPSLIVKGFYYFLKEVYPVDDHDTESYNIHFYLNSSNNIFRALIGYSLYALN
ncbi:conserved protein of unknown function [Clostridium beijerinckii]|nr:conserved protein of unknown function [Clostridium beijerinckii]